MSKKKLFVVSDAVVAPTGFGRVAQEVLDRLYDTGEWEIKQLGINYFDEDHDKPYRIFSATGGGNTHDFTGLRRFNILYNELQPDVTWLFQDFWHLANYIGTTPELRNAVTYFPVDSPNIKSIWALAQAHVSEVCTYTHFGAEEISKALTLTLQRVKNSAEAENKKTVKLINLKTNEDSVLSISAKRVQELTDPKNINIVPHGVTTSRFFPMNKEDAREQFGFNKEWFIVGNINRNQSRKRIDLMIRAFAEFAKDKPDVRLLLHDPIKTPEGWDLQQLASEYYGVGNKILLSNDTLKIEALNAMYNTVDVMVNSGGGEGWGLVSTESACAKVAQIVPNWSATAEIWKDTGILLDVVSVRHETGRLNTAQCVIDTDHLVRELDGLYQDRTKLIDLGEACYTKMMHPDYDWDNIAKQFNEIFHRAAEKPDNVIEELSVKDL